MQEAKEERERDIRKGEKVRVRVRRERERAEGSERVSAAHNSQALLVAVVVRP